MRVNDDREIGGVALNRERSDKILAPFAVNVAFRDRREFHLCVRYEREYLRGCRDKSYLLPRLEHTYSLAFRIAHPQFAVIYSSRKRAYSSAVRAGDHNLVSCPSARTTAPASL